MTALTREEHIARHVDLHRAIDELVADFIRHTNRRPNATTLMEFMEWSHQQTQNPTEPKRD